MVAGNLAAMPGSSTCEGPHGKKGLWGGELILRPSGMGCCLSAFQFCLHSVPLGFTFPDSIEAFFLSMHATLRVKHH